MEGEQKKKEAKFYSLVFRKWGKINPSEGEAPAPPDKLARVVRQCDLNPEIMLTGIPRLTGLYQAIRFLWTQATLQLLRASRLRQYYFVLYHQPQF